MSSISWDLRGRAWITLIHAEKDTLYKKTGYVRVDNGVFVDYRIMDMLRHVLVGKWVLYILVFQHLSI